MHSKENFKPLNVKEVWDKMSSLDKCVVDGFGGV
jgi:hypothetical protein